MPPSGIGLEQAFVLEPNSFVFLVGQSEYLCSRFQASPLASEFVIDDIADPEHYLRSIWNAVPHWRLEVTEDAVSMLQAFAQRVKARNWTGSCFSLHFRAKN